MLFSISKVKTQSFFLIKLEMGNGYKKLFAMKKHLFFIIFFFCLVGITFQLYSQSFKVPGVIVNHIPAKKQIYIGSPSICILPNGNYVASHDQFGPNSKYREIGTTSIYDSSDKGKTWARISLIEGQHWSNLFVFNNILYLLGTDKAHGNLIIRQSFDGGRTWSNPTDSSNGLLLIGEFHTAPMPTIVFNGRLWRAIEKTKSILTPEGKKYPQKLLSAMMLSVPINADFLDASNWITTNSLPHDSTYLNGKFGGWLEGNAVISPDEKVVNILRVGNPENIRERAAIIDISKDGRNATFDPLNGFINFYGGAKKFTIRYDELTKRYWSLTNYVKKEYSNILPGKVRNTLVIVSSSDLRHWIIHEIILEHPDVEKHGFQYIDWQFAGNDIIFLSRTAYDDKYGGANNQHDANYLTFHRVKNYKKLIGKNIL
jgi:hypothetical protein